MNTELKEKIQKLLNMAKRAGTEAEADNARRMVHQLLIKHNLSLSEVERETPSIDTFPIYGENTKPFSRWIWNGIAKLYFCDLFLRREHVYGEKRDYFCVIGSKENSEVVSNVSSFLVNYGLALARHMAAKQPAGNRRHYIETWLKGYGLRIAERCAKEIAEVVAVQKPNWRADVSALLGANMENLPAIASLYKQQESAIERYKEENNIELKTSRRRFSYRDENAFASGKNAADSVSLKGNSGKNLE